MYFTMWYGISDIATRELRYACAGHPAALLLSGPDGPTSEYKPTGTLGMVIGAFEGVDYDSDSCIVPEGGELDVFPDGYSEIINPDGSMLDVTNLESFLLERHSSADGPAAWFQQVMHTCGNLLLDDDFTMVRIQF